MDAACRLAADRRTVVVALRVIEVPAVLPLEAHMRDDEAAAHRLLERIAAVADLYGVAVTPRMVRGRDAAQVVLAHAARHRIELIVIGAPRKRHRAFGSTVEHVLKRASCRVLLITEAADAANLARHVAA